MSSRKCAIETFLRLKPRNEAERSAEYNLEEVMLEGDVGRGLLELTIPPDAAPGLVHNHSDGKISFEFDAVFDEKASQEDVFEVVVRDKIEQLFAGENSTIFAYGQTGSGKTYSIFGGETFRERGIIPRALGSIFNIIEKMQEESSSSVRLRLSFTEVYGESVFDLLDPQKRFISMEQWSPVQVMESEGELVLRNLNVYEVGSEEDALSLFFMGNTNRITSATPMNEASSRSHAIFTLMVEHEVDLEGGDRLVCSGKLNLVDLAGSERVFKRASSSAVRTEGKNINLSLHYLEQVIVRLRDLGAKSGGADPPAVGSNASANANRHVPYRNSVLTSILRDSLGGNCRSAFLLTVAVEQQYFDETVSTCRFGQRCGEVLVKVKKNAELDHESRIRLLESKVERLTRERDELRAAGVVMSKRADVRVLTDGERQMVTRVVTDFLSGVRPSAEETSPHSASARALKSTERFVRDVSDMDRAMVLEVAADLAGHVQRLSLGHPSPFTYDDTDSHTTRAVAPAVSQLRRADSYASSVDTGADTTTLSRGRRKGSTSPKRKQQQQKPQQPQQSHPPLRAESPDGREGDNGPGAHGRSAASLGDNGGLHVPLRGVQGLMSMPPVPSGVHGRDTPESLSPVAATTLPSQGEADVATTPHQDDLAMVGFEESFPGLTRGQYRRVTEGAVFLKQGRMGNKSKRIVSVSADLTQIQWRQESATDHNALPLRTVQAVTTGVQGKSGRSLVAIVGKPGSRSLFLDLEYDKKEKSKAKNQGEEYASGGEGRSKYEVAVEWTNILQLLVKHAK